MFELLAKLCLNFENYIFYYPLLSFFIPCKPMDTSLKIQRTTYGFYLLEFICEHKQHSLLNK